MICDAGGIRIRARFSAVWALLATCVFISPASARQTASSGATQVQPATAKPTTTTPSTKAPGSSPSAATTKSTATHSTSARKHSRKRRSARGRGQKKIDPERARTIQEALIREHYLSGEPTGTWNQASEDAMRRYQSDHGWQTKEVPDSRALISLGLGPSKDHLLNPESAMTSGPEKAPAALPTPAPQSQPAPPPTPASTPDPNDPSKPQ